MQSSEIDIEETHIRLTTDVSKHDLRHYIYNLRSDLKSYINRNQDFLLSIEPIAKRDENLPVIIDRMIESSSLADVGPMACVAGTVSELSLDYLMEHDSRYSIVENGGDIAIVNDRKVLCGIYSNNQVLGNNIAFEITSFSFQDEVYVTIKINDKKSDEKSPPVKVETEGIESSMILSIRRLRPVVADVS